MVLLEHHFMLYSIIFFIARIKNKVELKRNVIRCLEKIKNKKVKIVRHPCVKYNYHQLEKNYQGKLV